MARDQGLEELLRDMLGPAAGLAEKAMFGGRAWLLHGNLLCGAGSKGLLLRLGKGNDAWALEHPDIERMEMRGHPLEGWVRAGPEAYGDDDLRQKLLDAALAFVRGLPVK